jgi:hypothetical protein
MSAGLVWRNRNGDNSEIGEVQGRGVMTLAWRTTTREVRGGWA